MEWQPSTPLSDEELVKLPVFPLPRVVFFPGTALPLHFFEPRYTRMIEECLERGCTAMAVALLAPGWGDNYEGNPLARGESLHIKSGTTERTMSSCTVSTAYDCESSQARGAPTAARAPSPSKTTAARRRPT